MKKRNILTLDEFVVKKPENLSNQEFANLVNSKYGTSYNGESLRRRRVRLLSKIPKEGEMKMKPKDQLALDIESSKGKMETNSLEKMYRVALRQIAKLESALHVFEKVKPITTYQIIPKERQGLGEAVAVVLASDWHIEEIVRPEEVNDRNEHNLAISKMRVDKFFRGVLRLTEITGRDVKINTLVLALLGDFITNDIHEEMLETTELEPTKAIIECQNRIASGIEFLLKNTQLNIVLPCHSGNHARTTEKTRNATEAGHSLEYMMYHSLAGYFRNEKRVKFLISNSYHSYIEVFGMTIRFHHGHNVRYAGGIGGLTIPVNKAIAQWNKLRWADIDCFGHFHQRFDGGNFLANGSLIGYNAFALAIKAGFEKPSQQFFLVDKKRGKTATWPIFVD